MADEYPYLTKLKLAGLTLDPRLQMRDPDLSQHPDFNSGMRARYKGLVIEALAVDYSTKTDELDPVKVVIEEGEDRRLVVDGFNTVAAYDLAGKEFVPCEIVAEGPFKTALLEACRANSRHGLPRTAEDKARAVTALLDWLKENGQPMWTGRSIATACRVSEGFVNKTVIPAWEAQQKAEAKAQAAENGKADAGKKPSAFDTQRRVDKSGRTVAAKKKPAAKKKLDPWPFQNALGAAGRELDKFLRAAGEVDERTHAIKENSRSKGIRTMLGNCRKGFDEMAAKLKEKAVAK